MNEKGRALLARLLREYSMDHIGYSDAEQEAVAEARELIAAPGAAKVREDIAAMIDRRVKEIQGFIGQLLREDPSVATITRNRPMSNMVRQLMTFSDRIRQNRENEDAP